MEFNRAGCSRWAAVALIVLAAFYVWYLLQPPSSLEFWLHRGRYEALVAAIKARGATLKPSNHYVIRQDLDPKTLIRPSSAGGHRDWDRVYFSRSPSGQYEIDITTTDLGHMGYLGYIYSDGPQPSRDYPVWPIQPHWWAFHDNRW